MSPRFAHALLLTSALAPTRAAAGQAPAATEELEQDLAAIAAAVREKWSYYDDHREHFGVDVDALHAEARAAVPAVQSAQDWFGVLRRFAAGLQDGHAIVGVPGAVWAPARRLPLRVEDCAQGLVVTVVEPEVTGNAGPTLGDLVLALDGVPVEQRIAELERVQLASTPGMRRRAAIRALHAVDSEGVTLTLAGIEGPDDPNRAAREVKLATVPAWPTLPPSRPTPENWSLEWPREDVGLLHLSSFTVPRWSEWLAAEHEDRDAFAVEARARIEAIVDELNEREAGALIVDLRGNGGGTDLLGIHLAERLLAGRFRYFLLSAKLDDGSWTTPSGIVYGEGEHPRFLGRLVLLVDAGCFSTTDNFARCMTDLHPDVTVVGRPTGGGTGAPRVFLETPHTGASFGACTQRVRGPKGELTEGRGTQPDVPVRWTRSDWTAGRDPDLEAALRELER